MPKNIRYKGGFFKLAENVKNVIEHGVGHATSVSMAGIIWAVQVGQSAAISLNKVATTNLNTISPTPYSSESESDYTTTVVAVGIIIVLAAFCIFTEGCTRCCTNQGNQEAIGQGIRTGLLIGAALG